ncbi:MAG: cytochrome c [Pseudomonadota bacterium]
MFEQGLAGLHAGIIFWCLSSTPVAAQPLGLGTSASADFVAQWDIAIGPRGEELPPGQGSAAEGQRLYVQRCAMCHGITGREGPDPVLVGGQGSLTTQRPLLTIGSFWRYATTLYDYIYRAMPFNAPGSLEPDEVYALAAYLLNANGVIDRTTVLDRETLPAIVMPNRDQFYPDPRPDVGAQPGS